MSKFSAKWRMIKAVLQSNNCILIYDKKEATIKQQSFSNDFMYERLAARLLTFVKKWREQWNRMASYKEPEVPES